MVVLPEDEKLISFFESEPKLVDRGVPWIYNMLTFITVRDGCEVCCEIGPSLRHLSLKLKLVERTFLEVVLQNVQTINLESHNGKETLLASDGRGTVLVLQLQPQLHVYWSNTRESGASPSEPDRF